MRIVWSPQSLRDLDAIHEYIAKDSEHYAVSRESSPLSNGSSSFRTLGESFRSEMNLKFAKSSLDVFVLCIAFEMQRLR
ncbi:MAG TPA: hypothetical protein VKB77_04105 [Terriglobales bacterium]|nr:hypothetical protein [Terriglobales bacterium]